MVVVRSVVTFFLRLLDSIVQTPGEKLVISASLYLWSTSP